MRDFGGLGLDEIFGATRRSGARRGRRKGPDVRLRLPLTLEEVATGTQKTLRIDVSDPCAECGGTGAEGGAAPVTCETCGGAGEVRRVQRSMLGQLMSVTPCPTCGGEGQRIEARCDACNGRGTEPGEATLEVEVPAGVSSGDYITLRGKGGVGVRGGSRGDVYVVLDVQEDPRFVREGADLLYELPVTYAQAALGDRVEVPTVRGSVEIEIPRGTQSGTIIRIRNEGLPQLQSQGRGDQLVRVVVWVATDMGSEEERLVRRLREVGAPAPERVDPDREAGGFWSRVRQAFSA